MERIYSNPPDVRKSNRCLIEEHVKEQEKDDCVLDVGLGRRFRQVKPSDNRGGRDSDGDRQAEEN